MGTCGFFLWVRLEGCVDHHLLHLMPRASISVAINLLPQTTLCYAQKELRLYFYTLFTSKKMSSIEVRISESGRSVFDSRNEEEFCLHCCVDTGSEYLSFPVCNRCWIYVLSPRKERPKREYHNSPPLLIMFLQGLII